ncbi:MAG: Rab family GTPase [Promethearchaeota archaeon]
MNTEETHAIKKPDGGFLFKIKVCVVGVNRVGKTSLIRQYVTHKFSESYDATIGMDITVKEIDLTFGLISHHVTLSIHDLGGHYRFESLHQSFLKGADAAIIVVAQDDPDSLYGKKDLHSDQVISIKDWVERLEMANKNRYVPKILVINKSDLKTNYISDREIRKICNEIGGFLGAYRTSAKTGENVNKVFSAIAGIPLIRDTHYLQLLENAKKK